MLGWISGSFLKLWFKMRSKWIPAVIESLSGMLTYWEQKPPYFHDLTHHMFWAFLFSICCPTICSITVFCSIWIQIVLFHNMITTRDIKFAPCYYYTVLLPWFLQFITFSSNCHNVWPHLSWVNNQNNFINAMVFIYIGMKLPKEALVREYIVLSL